MKAEVVKCATCGTEFGAIPGMAKSRQAYRCAAEVFGDKVTGHFGSTVIDMEEWRFPKGRPDTVKEGVICDSCIEHLRDSGSLELNRTGIW